MALGQKPMPPGTPGGTRAPAPRGADGAVEPWFGADRELGGPVPLGLVATEWARFTGNGAADAGGACDVTLQAPQDRVLLIDRIVVRSSSAATSAVSVYIGDALDGNLEDFTPAGNGDVADESSPIVVPAGALLRIRWTGATAGATCTTVVRYRKAIIR